MLDERRHALQRVRALRDLRRLPVPRAREVRRRGARRAAGARARQRDAADRTPRPCASRPTPAGTTVTGVVVEHDGASETLHRATSSSSPAARPTAPSCCSPRRATRHPRRPGQRLRPGRAQLHVPQQPGGARAVQGAEPDGVPEDARAQRLLLRRRRRRLPAGQHPDGRQVVGRDVPRREAAADQARARVDARRRRRATPSTSGCRPRTCRGPRTASRCATTAASRSRYTPTNDVPKKRLLHELKSMLGHLGMHHDHLIPRHAYLKNEIPVAGVRPPGRHVPLRHRPGDLGARHATAARTRSTTSTSSTRASSRASAR